MHYPGSKDKIARDILFYVLKNRNGRAYVEPFMGGGNVMAHVSQSDGPRYGNDINPYLIALWKALQSGWNPPEFVTEETYQRVKNNRQSYDPALVGYVGFVCSFNGGWFAGYKGIVVRSNTRKDGTNRVENQQQYSRKNIMQQCSAMIGVHLQSGSYIDMYLPDDSIVFCDPPYADVSRHYVQTDFDHAEFWQWVRDRTNLGASVFVTEYKAPDDFMSIWEESVESAPNIIHGRLHPNRLYIHRSMQERIDLSPPVRPELPKMRKP